MTNNIINDLKEFTNINFGTVRAFNDAQGQPWFVGIDICKCLEIKNPWDSLSRLYDNERDDLGIPEAIGRIQNTIIINISGLFHLIFISRKPNAQLFQQWVYNEVLPKLFYSYQNNKQSQFISPVVLAPKQYIDRYNALQEQCDLQQQQINQLQQNNINLQNQVNVQLDYIDSIQSKASYYDECMNNNHIISTTQIAKDFGLSPQKLHSILYHLHIIYPCNDDWVIYKDYEKRNYTITQNKNSYNVITGWTEIGRRFIYDLLVSNGYIRNN